MFVSYFSQWPKVVQNVRDLYWAPVSDTESTQDKTKNIRMWCGIPVMRIAVEYQDLELKVTVQNLKSWILLLFVGHQLKEGSMKNTCNEV